MTAPDPFLKVLSLDEPWATLLMLTNGAERVRVKTWETRDAPPAGDLCPAGVRPGPGFRLDRGTRLGIHATDRAPALQGRLGDYVVAGDMLHHVEHPTTPVARLFRRRILGTVTVAAACPIIGPDRGTSTVEGQGVVIRDGDRLTWHRPNPASSGLPWRTSDISDQLPYGWWEPGRWAILMTFARRTSQECPRCAGTGHDPAEPVDLTTPAVDVGPCPVCLGARGCAPIVTAGAQGVWRWPRKGVEIERSTRVHARVSLDGNAADRATLLGDDHGSNEPPDNR